MYHINTYYIFRDSERTIIIVKYIDILFKNYHWVIIRIDRNLIVDERKDHTK